VKGRKKAKEPFQGVGKCKETEFDTGKLALLSKFVEL